MPDLDIIAVAWFALVICGYWLITDYGPVARRSIVAAVHEQRMRWMRNMAARDNRIVDAHLLGTLGQGNAFFASTSAIAVGGLAAIMGSGDKVQVMFERLPYAAHTSPVLWETKVIFLTAIFVFAFFKFAWAFRLSHYAGIMIGATPILDDANRTSCEGHAERTAKLVSIAAEHTNGGIRAFYYAIAAMAWFFHPAAFIAATTWVLLILIRRDFFSRSRRLIAMASH